MKPKDLNESNENNESNELDQNEERKESDEFYKQSIESLFLENGTPVVIQGNNPLLIMNEHYIWYVQSGHVDLFAVTIKEEESTDKRRYLFSAETGRILFGFRPVEAEVRNGLLVTGSEDTKLLRLELGRLQEAAAFSEFNSVIAEEIDQWIQLWSAALRTKNPPADFLSIEHSDEITVPKDKVLRSMDTLWVSQQSGVLQWMEDHPIHFEGVTPIIPLTSLSWLSVQEESRISACKTTAWMAQDRQWDGLSGFHSIVSARLKHMLMKEELTDRDQLRKRTESDHLLMNRALSRLVEVTAGIKNRIIKPAFSADPLYMACRIAGESSGIDIKPSLKRDRAVRASNPLHDIAQASNVRSRQVVLKGNWWKEDSGPLVAFMEEDGRPVALIPQTHASYKLIDPASGMERTITPEIAQMLNPMAHMFYRSLPAHPLKVMDILRFGAHKTIKRDLVVMLLMGIAAGILGMFMPIANGILFDTVIPESNRYTLLQMTFILLTVTASTMLFQLTRSMAMLRIEGRMDGSIQAAVWDRLLNLPVSFFRDFTAGDLALRANSINSIRKMMSGVVITSIFSGIFSSFNFILLFHYDVTLALIAGGLVLISMVVTSTIGIMQVRYERELLHVQGKISGMVLQLLNGISKFRMAAAENRAFFLWANWFAKQKELSFKSHMLSNWLSVFQSFFPIVTSMILFYFVASRSEALSAGQFIAFFSAFTAFLTAMMAMSSAIVSIINIVPLFERAKPILETVPEIHEQLEDPGDLSGAIEVKHLHFRYHQDQPMVIKDISLQIRSGEFVAFIGASGCGKSTLVRLLLGFEKPEMGSIFFDGQDLKTLDVGLLRNQFGVVLQNGKMMSGDIFTNIVGSSNLTLEDAWEAATMAGMDADIRSMPMGMHTVVSEGGSTLSGGQRQRLLIARAIARKPRIIFFDEATSALDNRTQAIVSESLEKLQATRIVIAHRLSTIRNADRIYVFDKGGIVQTGTYQELTQRDGLFADLSKRQLA
ncbi:NHLP bacteriocin export ABC transporter permease/ATPase subunit [Paenibacillus eucommiae]|uniref:NHLM bacteriocin system ABC transporter ATP-binding protein n=1 Tax=Paenibacillus eucommiae TaxID=1355755 RepID=A0ABS4IQZ1_9BACL|nr:NHLP bacteriocin export ABC transporter permease/ATPase subunit [Paenibacillus eucommiae]MBP1989989.1 NHLM bacteriocin system ABC transporter ATP-binding protein [Paenibacillus eucommiae]